MEDEKTTNYKWAIFIENLNRDSARAIKKIQKNDHELL